MKTQDIAWFESPEEAADACRKLEAAGVPASIIESAGEFRVQVPEEFACVSLQLIVDPGDAGVVAGSMPVACPECGSFETRILPPYALIAGVSIFGVVVVLYFLRYQAVAFALVVVGWLLVIWLSRFTGKTRCMRCGWRFSA